MNTDRSYSDKLGNFNYDVILPPNITADTKIIVYSTSTNDDWGAYSKLKESILSNDMDAIVIMPTSGWTTNDDYANSVHSVVNGIKNNYNIKSDGYIGSGFSNPSIYTMKATTKYISDNPGCERQYIFLNDAVPMTAIRDSEGNYSWHDTAITDEEINLLKENNAFIIDYCRPDSFTNIGRRLLNSGVDILFICDDNLPEGSFNTKHSYINNKAFSSDGIYNNVLGFLFEGDELPTGYTYYMYNHETNNFDKYCDPTVISSVVREKYHLDVINYNKERLNYISNLDILAMFNSNSSLINSDSNHIRDLIDNIMNNIKAYGNNLENGFTTSSFESTTRIPSQITNVVQKYAVYNTDLIYKLTDLLTTTVNLALNYDKIEKKLSNEVENLDATIKSDASIQATNEMPLKTAAATFENGNTVAAVTTGITTINNVINSQQINTNKNNINIKEPERVVSNYNIKTNNTSDVDEVNDDFLEYDEISSDDNKAVFVNEDNNCKIVVYKNGNEITGIEYYYKYENDDMAKEALDDFKDKYANNDDVTDIIINDNIVKIIYKQDAFGDNIDSVKEALENFNEI